MPENEADARLKLKSKEPAICYSCHDELKKGLNDKISNPRIDELYETARKAGALGGKITGAGGGGFLLLYCPRDKKDAVYKALENYRELPFGFEDDGSKVIFNYRRNG